MSKTDKKWRLDLYKDRGTQALISKFLSGEISALDPIYDPRIGYRYPMVETIVGDASEAESFLNRLYEAGILERKLYDKVIYCPKCGSANISIHYCCPYCKSVDVQRSALIEHVKCGYMDVEEHFRKGNKLVCPKCRGELRKVDVDYRKAGMWCTCNDCGRSFDIPVVVHFCRDCRTNFTFEDSIIKNVYTYRLNEEVKGEASLSWVMIAPIRDLLVESGFEVESPALLKGKSGANHMFDIVARIKGKREKFIVIDLSTSMENAVSEQPVIALFAKMFDVSPNSAYLIAVPKMNENGKKMAESYNIKVVEAKDTKEAMRMLKEKISKE